MTANGVSIELHCDCGARASVPAFLSGRRVRCRGCGGAVRVASAEDEAPLALVEEEDEPAALGTCRMCCAPLARNARACMRCGQARRRARTGGAARRGRRRITRVQPREELKEIVLPLGMTAASFVTYLALVASSAGSVAAGAAFIQLSLGMAAWLAISVLSCILAGQFMFKSNFGAIHSALLKLSAVGIVPDVLAALAILCLPGVGIYVAWVTLLVGTWLMYSWLFDMSLPEAIFYSFLNRLCVWFALGLLAS